MTLPTLVRVLLISALTTPRPTRASGLPGFRVLGPLAAVVAALDGLLRFSLRATRWRTSRASSGTTRSPCCGARRFARASLRSCTRRLSGLISVSKG
jgi:hypothetical protein